MFEIDTAPLQLATKVALSGVYSFYFKDPLKDYYRHSQSMEQK